MQGNNASWRNFAQIAELAGEALAAAVGELEKVGERVDRFSASLSIASGSGKLTRWRGGDHFYGPRRDDN